MSNVPYIKERGQSMSTLNCPCCHNELDIFHSESCFDDKKCKFCNCELEKSDYQIAYDLQCDLSHLKYIIEQVCEKYPQFKKAIDKEELEYSRL